MKEHAPGSLARAIRWSAVIVAAVVVGTIGLTGTALANFPHFNTASATTVTSTANSVSLASGQPTATVPDLLFTWTEAGLATTPPIDYLLETTVTATFGCVNNGSHHPTASNKTTVSEGFQGTAELTADKNGKISASKVVPTSSVSPPAGFSCPSGQTEEALSATYSGNKITDKTNGVSATIGDIVVNLGP